MTIKHSSFGRSFRITETGLAPSYLHSSFKFTPLIICIFLCCRVNWMLYQGMVCLAGNQIWWTWEVEDVFRKVRAGNKTAMKEYAKKQHKQIDDLVVKVS